MSQFNVSLSFKTNILMTLKEQLDKRRVNYNAITLQSAPTFLKLLQMIKQLQVAIQKYNNLSVNCNQLCLDDVLKKYQTIFAQNNALHLELIKLKDQVCLLTTKLKDVVYNQTFHEKQQSIELLLSARQKDKEQHLLQQLKNSIYKYNQLLDFLHQNPHLQRNYIKRLLKHKHLKLDPQAPVVSTWRPFQHSANKPDHHNSTLQAQLQIRNQQIQRLQSKCQNQYKSVLRRDCSNQQLFSKINLLEEEVARLSQQNFQLKKGLRANLKEANDKFQNKVKRVKSLKNIPFIYKTIKAKELEKLQHTAENESLSQSSGKQMLTKKINQQQTLKYNKQKRLSQAPNCRQSNQEKDINQRVYILAKNKSTMPTQSIPKHLRNLKSESKQLTFPQNHSDQKGLSQEKSIHSKSSKNKQVKKHAFPHKVSSQQLTYYENLLKEKDEKIRNYQSLLKVIKANKKITNNTHSINSQKMQTNNVIINQHHNEYITYKTQNKSSKKYLTKAQSQLQKSMAQCTRLQEKVRQLESRLKANESDKQEGSNFNQNSKQILQEVRQRLFQVNKQNIDLQVQLNQALETIKHFRAKPNSSQKQSRMTDTNELNRVLKQRDDLLAEIETLRKENFVLAKQLRQTQKQLQLQRKDMLDFQTNIKYKREI